MFNPSPKIIMGKDINLLIGVNGSGKSTVLEAIAIIFSTVSKYCEDDKTDERQFNFSIEYSFTLKEVIEETSTIQNASTSINHVILSSSRESGSDYSMTVNGSLLYSKEEMIKYLPDNLIFYYAGFCNTLEEIVSEIADERAIKLYKLKNQKNLPTVINNIAKNIIYIKNKYYPLLFLLNFIDETDQIIPLSIKSFQIQRIQFHLQRPRISTSNDFNEFYNIQGFLRNYLDKLKISAQEIEEIKDGNAKHIGSILTIEYHRSIIEVIEELTDLPDIYRIDYSKYLAFHFISLLFHIGILKNITIAIKDVDGNIYDINDFSEGERQLITIDAINKVLCKGNTLLFFDEPDAFLHPQRQREILPYLCEKFDNRFSDDYVQLIITTHSPFVAQSINIENIIMFNEIGEVKNDFSDILDYKVLAKELFGIEKRFSDAIETKLSEFRQYRDKIMKDESIEIREFKALIEDIENFGEETSIIINRELSQLKSLKNFEL
jgi:predicted ATPase